MMFAAPRSFRSARSLLGHTTAILVCTAFLVICPGLCRGAGAIGAPSETPAPSWTDPITGMEFVLVPGGCFEMGRAPGVEKILMGEVDQWFMDRHYGNETPRYEVCVEPFWLSRHEVTQGQWEAVTGQADQGCEWTGRGEALPASFITYENARDYAAELSKQSANGESFRLPTEAEWEFACRAGADAPFSTGWDITPDDARFTKVYELGTREKLANPARPKTVAPVGSFTPNAYGVCDMHGNVAEWTSTLYTPQPGVEPVFEKRESHRVIKGGSYADHPRSVRCGARKGAKTGYISCQVGARLVRVPPVRANEADSAAQ
ncbi:hypothetical protein DPQ33_03000 [Oceanidesulfovibrio indonesiensis]|uniref:Sulfatase-modifying factor enzyme-like domain-containing protein n=1 Tax=Oceanidesulfovibrio indonesiensis TaxID=54767 RepID=A0A7M3MI20_9BACT|nr:SUMF1/EgtB/PvdO family nonheme iron enzyme [Oceanidesulfovibrio indonesiensis]TVM19342.1 hypothetical protein DPQ33_03000 [Oceanidesulfovibrio indonesiensis]